MIKDKYFQFSIYKGIDVKNNIGADPIELPAFDDSQLGQVIREIFSVDPESGNVRGDLAYFLSPDGNPQVKQWLENNLLSPRSKQTGSSIDGVTDDLIAEMSIMNGENANDYQTRLVGIYNEAKANFEKFSQESKTD